MASLAEAYNTLLGNNMVKTRETLGTPVVFPDDFKEKTGAEIEPTIELKYNTENGTATITSADINDPIATNKSHGTTTIIPSTDIININDPIAKASNSLMNHLIEYMNMSNTTLSPYSLAYIVALLYLGCKELEREPLKDIFSLTCNDDELENSLITANTTFNKYIDNVKVSTSNIFITREKVTNYYEKILESVGKIISMKGHTNKEIVDMVNTYVENNTNIYTKLSYKIIIQEHLNRIVHYTVLFCFF